MTKDEAISTLRNTAWLGTDKKVGQVEEAIQIAIDALQTDGDAISRAEVLDMLKTGAVSVVVDGTWDTYDAVDGIVTQVKEFFAECVEELPSAQPTKVNTSNTLQTLDCVDRRAAIDALNEYFVRIGKLKRRGLTKGEKAISLDTVGAIKTLPSAQPLVIHCTDCEDWYKSQNVWNVAISELPSVQPEVIRCKDCIWYLKDKNCARHMKPFKPNGFCSEAAERRTDETD